MNATIQVKNPLSRTAMLVTLRVSTWSGLRQDKRITRAAADDTGAERSSLTGGKHMVPKALLDDVTSAAGAVRAEHYALTLPWEDGGARILKGAAFFDYQQRVGAKVAAFDAAADAFARAYPMWQCPDVPRCEAIIAAKGMGLCPNHQRLSTLYDPRMMPDRIRDRFSASYVCLPFPDASDFRVDGVTAAAEAEIRAQLAALPATVEATAQAEIADRIRTVAQTMVDRLRGYTGGKAGAFRDSLVTNVRDLVDVLPALNLTNDPRVDDLRADLATLSRVEPEDLRKDAALRDATATDAQAVLDKMGAFL